MLLSDICESESAANLQKKNLCTISFSSKKHSIIVKTNKNLAQNERHLVQDSINK